MALTSWSLRGIPNQPGAWLYRVAVNSITDQFRHDGVVLRTRDFLNESPDAASSSAPHLEGEISDDELRMLYICCDEALPPRTQLILALKILCGFSVAEIAFRLLKSEESIHKRIARGRQQCREGSPNLDSPNEQSLRSRLPSVQKILYLLFNEGYSSCLPDQPIRKEMCEEALRLCKLMVGHPSGDTPESWALLALMHLHHARIDARTDGAGAVLLLEQQDRSQWDSSQIQAGLLALHRCARGDVFSRYHAEAGVLAEHCIAPSYSETNWEKIVDLYSLLESIEPSPLHTLNRAIAMGEWKGPQSGLDILLQLSPPSWLLGYYLWDATKGELYRRLGHMIPAKRHLLRALETAPTNSEKDRIRRRLSACTE